MVKLKINKLMVVMVSAILMLSTLTINQPTYAVDNSLQVAFNEVLIDDNTAEIEMTIMKDDKYEITSVTLPSLLTINSQDMEVNENPEGVTF